MVLFLPGAHQWRFLITNLDADLLSRLSWREQFKRPVKCSKPSPAALLKHKTHKSIALQPVPGGQWLLQSAWKCETLSHVDVTLVVCFALFGVAEGQPHLCRGSWQDVGGDGIIVQCLLTYRQRFQILHTTIFKHPSYLLILSLWLYNSLERLGHQCGEDKLVRHQGFWLYITVFYKYCLMSLRNHISLGSFNHGVVKGTLTTLLLEPFVLHAECKNLTQWIPSICIKCHVWRLLASIFWAQLIQDERCRCRPCTTHAQRGSGGATSL